MYFNKYEQAKTLYENMEFSNFLFDSESALALVQYFQKYKESGVSESIISKAWSASENAYYIQAFKNKLSNYN